MYVLDFFYLQGAHQQQVLADTNNVALPKPVDATHILIEPMVNALRYTLDTTPATAALGFWLPAGAARVLYVQGPNLNVAAAVAGTIIDYQWLVRQGS